VSPTLNVQRDKWQLSKMSTSNLSLRRERIENYEKRKAETSKSKWNIPKTCSRSNSLTSKKSRLLHIYFVGLIKNRLNNNESKSKERINNLIYYPMNNATTLIKARESSLSNRTTTDASSDKKSIITGLNLKNLRLTEVEKNSNSSRKENSNFLNTPTIPQKYRDKNQIAFSKKLKLSNINGSNNLME